MWPRSFHRLAAIVFDSFSLLVSLYNLSFVIVCGHFIPSTFLSCFLWKLLRFRSSALLRPHVPQLYVRQFMVYNRAKDLLTELIYLFCLDRLLYILT